MDEQRLHQFLDVLLPLRRACQRPDASGEVIQRFLADTLSFVRLIMTEDVFRRAMRSADEGEGLLLLANRVAQMEPLLADNWPDDFSFDDVKRELFAIANGDQPSLLSNKGVRGRDWNAHALVEHKLECRAWYMTLGRLGVKAPARQAIVTNDYVVTIAAFDKWQAETKAKLGGDYVNRYLHSSVETKLAQAADQHDGAAWAVDQMREAGSAYRREAFRTHT